jgi:hypothetical protein
MIADRHLSAVRWVADGKTRFEVADLLGCSVRQLAEWLRLFRNRGLADHLSARRTRATPSGSLHVRSVISQPAGIARWRLSKIDSSQRSRGPAAPRK